MPLSLRKQSHVRDDGSQNAERSDCIWTKIRFGISNISKQKRTGEIKGKERADGRPQGDYMTKEEDCAATVSIEALMLSWYIDFKEGRDFGIMDIPGAFMQADTNEIVLLKMEEVWLRICSKHTQDIPQIPMWGKLKVHSVHKTNKGSLWDSSSILKSILMTNVSQTKS